MKKFINNLNNVLDEEFNVSVTENGAIGYRTTGKDLLDMNFNVSSFRNVLPKSIAKKFNKAFFEDKMLAIKWMFFAGDVRGGLGERRLFRILLQYLAENELEIALKLLPLVPEYTRWDNLLPLLDTELKLDVCALIKTQLDSDVQNMKDNKSVSLLAKWLPSINATSSVTKSYAKILVKELGLTEREYRKLLSTLRAYLDVVEVKMSSGKWDEIKYEAVPSRANLIYNGVFIRNDEERRRAYLASLEKGETTINAGVLFPHDIVYKYAPEFKVLSKKDVTLEELWKALPNYVEGNSSTICVADGSGSMCAHVGKSMVTCLAVANALAIYFAERCSGVFKDKYITFSENPQLVDLSKGKTLRDKIRIALSYDEVANTNIEAVFDLILASAVKGNMKQEDLPSNVLILSDMEFDCATSFDYTHGDEGLKLFDEIALKYKEYGYKLPRLIFWNIYSRTSTIPLKENKLGVALVSGFSPVVMKMVLSNKLDPFECLLEQLNAPRYDKIENAIKGIV